MTSEPCWNCGCRIMNRNVTCEHSFPVLRAVMFTGLCSIAKDIPIDVPILIDMDKLNYAGSHYECNKAKRTFVHVLFKIAGPKEICLHIIFSTSESI